MSSFIQNKAKSRILTVGMGLLATSAPVFAQAPAAPVPAAPAPAAPAVPTTDPQAKALLDQVIARYGALNTLTVSDNDGQSTELIQFKAPMMAKITSTNDQGKVSLVQVYTGKDRIVMQKPNDVYEYVSSPLKPAPADKAARTQVSNTSIGGPLISSMLAGLNPFREDGPYKATSYTMGQPTTKDGVLLTPVKVTTVKPADRPFDLTFTLFVNPKDNLIYRTEVELKLPNGKTQMFNDTFTNIKADADIPATTFAFTPPAGAVKVTKFSDPVVRAKVGTKPISLPAGAKDIDGKPITFDQFKGKVTLIDFWATWCGPCVAELPNVKAAYQKYHNQGFEIVGISLDRETAPLTKFIKDEKMPWRQVWDGYWNGPIADAYNVKSIPQTILLGKDGKIAGFSSYTKEGEPLGPRGENLEPAIKAALAAK